MVIEHNMEPVLGTNMVLWLDGVALVGATSTQLQTQTEFISVCSPEDGRAREYVPSTFGWDLQQAHLFCDAKSKDAMIDMQYEGQRFVARFYDEELEIVREGEVYIKTLSFQGEVNSLARFSVVFQPTGMLNRVEWQPLVLDTMDTEYIDGMRIEGDETNHHFVSDDTSRVGVRMVYMPCKGKMGMYTYASTETMILCKSSNMTMLMETIRRNDMVEFYQMNEMAHAFVRGLLGKDVLVEQGEYYIVYNAADYDRALARVLTSLPAIVE